MTRWARACLLALLGAASCEDDAADKPLVNRCTQAFECVKPTVCDMDLGFCVNDNVERPYPIVVLVVPPPPYVRFATSEQSLEGKRSLDPIKVQRAVEVSGWVADVSNVPVNAEVAFVPQVSSELTGSVSVFTAPGPMETVQGSLAMLDDGGVPTLYQFHVGLQPSTSYDVHVYPIGSDSHRLPPLSLTITTPDVVQRPTKLPYSSRMDTRRAVMIDEDKKPPIAGSKVRLRNKASQAFVSSIGTPDETTGAFDLDAPPDVWSSLTEHELVLTVPFGDAPQTVSIIFDATLLRDTAVLVGPAVPQAVSYNFTLELNGQPRNVNADMTFVSSFPNLMLNNAMRKTDWCKLHLAGAIQGTFRCEATVTSSVSGTSGTVKLLPGTYQVYASPNGNAQDPQRIATYTRSELINSQPDGMQNGQSYDFTLPVVYPGYVRSPIGQRMPGVVVTANALNVVQNLPEIARYNRSTEEHSDGRGDFQIAVDTGFYDLLSTPPPGTNFASSLVYNRRIEGPSDGGTESDASIEGFPVEPQFPVIARGTVFMEAPPDGGTASVRPARIEAYALVPDLRNEGRTRPVRIATTQTDDRGGFALALPTWIGDRPEKRADGGVATSGLVGDLDAGL